MTICHPFEDYVKKIDPEYTYTEVQRVVEEDKTIVILNQTSLRWMDGLFCFNLSIILSVMYLFFLRKFFRPPALV